MNNSEPTKSRFIVTDPLFRIDDIVLDEQQKNTILEILTLAKKESLIFHTWGLENVIKRGRGLKVNLFGPSGTGKTMVAHAIASELQQPLLVVDYAEIESKYVGETSKNIVSVFRVAEEQGAVLLFDEADAMLSRRVTEMHTSSDVSVNQTRSVLLTLLDGYDGICLFTTNFIQNYDPAFMRRITRHILFDMPNVQQREKLWAHYLVPQLPTTAEPKRLAEKIEGVTGADIANAVLAAAIHGAANNLTTIPQDVFEKAMTDVLRAKRDNQGSNVRLETRNVSEKEAVHNISGGIKA